jgi:predicted TIM-barrel fold metal-dependent hydrolase
MQIIDAHVHIGRRHLPLEEVQAVLDSSGVDRAVVFADPESGDIPDDNSYVLEVADRTDHIPFYYIGGNAYSTNRPFPELPGPEVLTLYRGIKWHCWFTPGHDLGGTRLGMDRDQVRRALTEPRMKALMEKAREMGIPVNFEEHFDVTIAFVDLYPDVSIIIPHMGGLNGGTDRILAAIGDKPNVYFDVSLAGITEGLVRRYGAEKFLCGSDHPYGSPGWSVERIRVLDISDAERERIFSGNILSLAFEP